MFLYTMLQDRNAKKVSPKIGEKLEDGGQVDSDALFESRVLDASGSILTPIVSQWRLGIQQYTDPTTTNVHCATV